MTNPSPIAFYRYTPAACLTVSGPDAAEFLQGQFTNDLRQAGPGQAVYGLWLSQQGKVVADSFILRQPGTDAFILMSYFSPGPILRDRLERYIVADDVQVADSSAQWSAVSLLGNGAGDWLATGGPAGFVFKGRRAEGENWEWIFPAGEAESAQARLAGRSELTASEMERMRIAAGIPAVPADIGPRDLPNEGGLDEIAISFTKGCYLGQEIISRLKSRGRIRRRLERVRLKASGSVLPPAPLLQAGQRVGELRSVAADPSTGDFLGLAMVNLGKFKPDNPIELAGQG